MTKEPRRQEKAELIKQLVARDGDQCRYCGDDFSNRDRTIDHIYPKVRAKADGWSIEKTWALDNLALSCQPCNGRKSDRLLLPDGSVPFDRRDRAIKVPRPPVCQKCSAGRALGPDETCPSCGSGPKPDRLPRWAKVSPTECEHDGVFWCWLCSIGLVG